MAKGSSSKFVTSFMPKTGWKEPPRTRDELLRLPKRRYPLTPTNELRISMPVDAVLNARVSHGEAPGDETSFLEQQPTATSFMLDSEASMSQLDDSSELSEEYDGDAEEDLEAGVLMADEFDDEERPVDEESDVEDKDLPTPPPSSPRSIPTSKHRTKAFRGVTESIHPHPTDASKVVITYRYTTPAGGVYVQETEMPGEVTSSASVSKGTGGVIFPDVESSKLPRTKKGLPWNPVPDTSGYEWTRGEDDDQETWKINIFFRRLDRDTHAYQDIYVNTNILKNVNPNNKRFRTSYNKWVLQFARRRDPSYTAKIVRVHWNTAERHALYTAINTFCAKLGLHRFGFTDDCKLSTAQMQSMADAVNNAHNPLRMAPRGVDAVRGQIVSAHDKSPPKNKAVFELLARANALRARIASGEAVARAERKPAFAIPLSDFPVESAVGTPLLALAHGSKKRKRAVVVETGGLEPSSSELSSPPASEIGEAPGSSAEDAGVSADEDNDVGGGGEGNWSDASEELLSGDGWVEVEEGLASPPVKKARET